MYSLLCILSLGLDEKMLFIMVCIKFMFSALPKPITAQGSQGMEEVIYL